MGRLEEIHNFKAIDKDIETSLLSIRAKINQKNYKLTEQDNHILKVAYKEITGRKPAVGCKGCSSLINIVNNWLNGYYDAQPKPLRVNKGIVKNKTEEVLSNPNPSYKELKEEAIKRGYTNKGKGQPKKYDLIVYLKNN